MTEIKSPLKQRKLDLVKRGEKKKKTKILQL